MIFTARAIARYGRGCASLAFARAPVVCGASWANRDCSRRIALGEQRPKRMTGRLSLIAYQVQRLSAQQSRHYGHLALNGKTLRRICIDARGGAFACFGRALRALLRGSALHRPSSLYLRLRFNLPQPDVSLNRAAHQPRTDGKPVCPDCGCATCYDFRRGAYPRWRCKACGCDFSVTSGTLFAWRPSRSKTSCTNGGIHS